MHILNVSQENTRGDWLMERLGRITGTKAGGIAEAAKNSSSLRLCDGFWQLMAETIADPPTTENAALRGHRLENQNASLVLDKEGIDPDTAVFDTGMWVDDDDERIACSPDVHEDSDKPEWAVECKSLSSARHLAAVVPYIAHLAITQPEKYPLKDDVLHGLKRVCDDLFDKPSDGSILMVPSKYRPQAIQYFIVNPDLETLYFSFYDPRIQITILQHVYIPIKRADVDRLIKIYRTSQIKALSKMDTLIGAMKHIDDEDIF